MKVGTVSIGRALALLWAAFWMFFFIAESVAWRTRPDVAAPWIAIALFFLILALVPWRWEWTGGVLLTTVGVLAGGIYAFLAPDALPVYPRVMTAATLGVPPLVAGILLLWHHRAAIARH